jgi:hypothetical protein
VSLVSVAQSLLDFQTTLAGVRDAGRRDLGLEPSAAAHAFECRGHLGQRYLIGDERVAVQQICAQHAAGPSEGEPQRLRADDGQLALQDLIGGDLRDFRRRDDAEDVEPAGSADRAKSPLETTHRAARVHHHTPPVGLVQLIDIGSDAGGAEPSSLGPPLVMSA